MHVLNFVYSLVPPTVDLVKMHSMLGWVTERLTGVNMNTFGRFLVARGML